MSLDLPYLSAVDLLAALRAKELSAVEALDALVARVEDRDPEINAVVTRDYEQAQATASAIDDARAEGGKVGDLAGLPMTVKDSLMTEGVVTTSGAPELADYVPELDAAPVARVKEAGAVVFGKTNLPLYAGDCQSYNEVYGTTNNPWDTRRSPARQLGWLGGSTRRGLHPRWRSAATSVAVSETRQACAALSATSRATASFPPRARSPARQERSRWPTSQSSGRWLVRWPTAGSVSTCSPGLTTGTTWPGRSNYHQLGFRAWNSFVLRSGPTMSNCPVDPEIGRCDQGQSPSNWRRQALRSMTAHAPRGSTSQRPTRRSGGCSALRWPVAGRKPRSRNWRNATPPEATSKATLVSSTQPSATAAGFRQTSAACRCELGGGSSSSTGT